MTDSFPWSISLGRWGPTHVRLHLILVLFLLLTLLPAALDQPPRVAATAGWLALLLVALALHELGHAAMAARLGFEQDEVQLWPLGNLVGPGPRGPAGGAEARLVAAAGPATSLAFALTAAVGLRFADAQQVFNPFGHGPTGGAPFLAGGRPAPAFSPVWWVGTFGYLNWVLFIANLIPAPPLDLGRFLRAALPSKDSLIARFTAHGTAIILGVAGAVRLVSGDRVSGAALIGLAVLIELTVRAESRVLDDEGFFDEGLFGYDFSQGYTSLEPDPQLARPEHEGALRRWRRRRSELRRRRRDAREAAEERRMDEILAKLSREGRAALTDEEQRFLIRVSLKLRNRSKARE